MRDERCTRPVVAAFTGDVRAGERTLLREVAVQVARGAHVVVSGGNGVGKTTLLGCLLSQCTLPAERVLVLPQELTLEQQLEDLEALHALGREARGRVLQLVDALGLDPSRCCARTVRHPARRASCDWRSAWGVRRGWRCSTNPPITSTCLGSRSSSAPCERSRAPSSWSATISPWRERSRTPSGDSKATSSVSDRRTAEEQRARGQEVGTRYKSSTRSMPTSRCSHHEMKRSTIALPLK